MFSKSLFLLVLSLMMVQFNFAFAKSRVLSQDGRYLVKMKEDISSSQSRSIFANYGFSVLKEFREIRVFLIKNNQAQRVESFQEEKEEEIIFMEPDYPVEMVKVPDDTRFPGQEALRRTGVLEAWDETTGSYKILVAVSDTGIARLHIDLVNQIWSNRDEIPGNGRDDDNNGHVDDHAGWNFVNNSNQTEDDNGHGTHVSGIIGAEGNNRYGVSGVNWEVEIMPLKFLDEYGRGTVSGGISSILYAANNKARVLNASWGSRQASAALEDAVNYAYEKGMLVIAAAGNNATNNDTEPFYPAAIKSEGLLAIASSVNNGELSSFSNFGKLSVHLAAPGSNVLSTYKDDSFERLSGTSMAAPMVTGVAALLLSKNPELGALTLRNILLSSVNPREEYAGLLSTEGDLDAGKALGFLGNGIDVFPKSITINAGETFQFTVVNARGKVQWSLSQDKKSLATIDEKGLLKAEDGDSGEVEVHVTDEQGYQAQTAKIRIIGNGKGGGCTREIQASNEKSNPAKGAASILGYLLIAAFSRTNIRVFEKFASKEPGNLKK